MDLRKTCGQAAVVGFTWLGIWILTASLWFGRSLFLLVFAGVLLCTLLRAITDFLHRRLRFPDRVALLTTVVSLLALATAVLILVAPGVEQQSQDLWHGLPATLAQARTSLQRVTDGTAGTRFSCFSCCFAGCFAGLHLKYQPYCSAVPAVL